MANIEELNSDKLTKNNINYNDDKSNDSSSLIIDEIVTIETTTIDNDNNTTDNNVPPVQNTQENNDTTISNNSNDINGYFVNNSILDFDSLSYKNLQRVAMGFDLPGNMKKDLLLQVVKARQQGNEPEVQRLISQRRTKRTRNASAPQTKYQRDRLKQQKENAKSHRQSVARASRTRTRTDSSGSSDPQWLPPVRYRKSNDKTYFGIAQSPTLLDSSSASLNDLMSESSRGTTPTLVNMSSPLNNKMSPVMNNVPLPPAYPDQSNITQHQQIMAHHQQQVIAQQQQQQQQQAMAIAQQQQQQQQQAMASTPAGNPQFCKKKATMWRDEYMKQQQNYASSTNNTSRTSSVTNKSQGEVVEGSAFRFQPYQRPQMPPLQKIASHPSPTPAPPSYPQQQQLPPPNYPYLHHNNALPYFNPAQSQLYMQYLMKNNQQQYPYPSHNQWLNNQQYQQETQQPATFPMLTHLLNNTQTNQSVPSCTVTSETSVDTASSSSNNNEVEITSEVKLTAKDGRPTKLIDMRNYPGNMLWEKFDQARKNENLLNDSTWLCNKTSNNNNNINPTSSIIPLQTSVLTATRPITPVPENPSIQNSINNHNLIPSNQNQFVKPENLISQESVVTHTNSIQPYSMQSQSFLDIPTTNDNNNRPIEQSVPGRSQGNSTTSHTDSSSTWISNYNWIPNPPQYDNITKNLIPVENKGEEKKEFETHDVDTHDLNIPEDIDDQYDAAITASWSDIPIIDENFLRSILSPTKMKTCKYQLNGCFESFITEAQQTSHEQKCLLRSVQCLMPPCKWVGVVSALTQHLTQVHGRKILKGREHAHIVQMSDLRSKSVIRFLQYAQDRLFVVEVHYRGQVVHAACQWIPDHQILQRKEFVPLGSLEIVGINGKPNSWRGVIQQYPTTFHVPRGYTGKNKCLSVALPWSYHAKLSYILLHVNLSFMPEYLHVYPGIKAPVNSPASPTLVTPGPSSPKSEDNGNTDDIISLS